MRGLPQVAKPDTVPSRSLSLDNLHRHAVLPAVDGRRGTAYFIRSIANDPVRTCTLLTLGGGGSSRNKTLQSKGPREGDGPGFANTIPVRPSIHLPVHPISCPVLVRSIETGDWVCSSSRRW